MIRKLTLMTYLFQIRTDGFLNWFTLILIRWNLSDWFSRKELNSWYLVKCFFLFLSWFKFDLELSRVTICAFKGNEMKLNLNTDLKIYNWNQISIFRIGIPIRNYRLYLVLHLSSVSCEFDDELDRRLRPGRYYELEFDIIFPSLLFCSTLRIELNQNLS